jgi:hypothetical protein
VLRMLTVERDTPMESVALLETLECAFKHVFGTLFGKTHSHCIDDDKLVARNRESTNSLGLYFQMVKGDKYERHGGVLHTNVHIPSRMVCAATFQRMRDTVQAYVERILAKHTQTATLALLPRWSSWREPMKRAFQSSTRLEQPGTLVDFL